MFFKELLFPEEDVSNQDFSKMLSELNNRLTWPLYNILLCMIALVPFIRLEFNRMGNIKPITICSAIALVSVVATLSTKSLSQKNQIYTAITYGLLVGEIIFFYYYLTKSKKPKT